MDLRSQKRRSFLAQHAGASSVSLGRTASKHQAAHPYPRAASSYSSLHTANHSQQASESYRELPPQSGDGREPPQLAGPTSPYDGQSAGEAYPHANTHATPLTNAHPHLEVKLVCVGDGGCGKTSLLTRFVRGTFPENYVPTVFDNYVKQVTSGPDTVELGLWDTAGQEEYDRLRVLSYAETQVFLVCYAVDNYVSLENISERWLPEIKLYCPDVPFLLVALKADRAKQTQVLAFEQGSQVAHQHGAYAHVECSAKEGVNVDQVFSMAVEAVLGPASPKSPKQTIKAVGAGPAPAPGGYPQAGGNPQDGGYPGPSTGPGTGSGSGNGLGNERGRPGARRQQPGAQTHSRHKHRCVIL